MERFQLRFNHYLLAALILLTSPGVQSHTGTATSIQKNNKNKTDKDQDKKARQEAKHFNAYDRLRTQGREKYGTDDLFRFEVNEAYKELRRQHSEYAFKVNTFDSRDERITFTGDKLKTEDTLYDNPLVQDYVNRVGQSLVPSQSAHRYAFKVVLNPVPDSRTISTGTVYITTGLLSVIDNEAQLAYILGHEIAHIEKNHWFEDALISTQLERDERRRDQNGKLISSISGIVGGMIGGFASQYLLMTETATILKFISPQKVFTWDLIQENEADQVGFDLMFIRNYDPREVPKLYNRLKKFAEKEPRTADGFVAQLSRIGQRTGFFNGMLGGMMVKPDLFRGASNLRAQREPADGGIVSPLEPGKAFGTSEEATIRELKATAQLASNDTLLKEKLEKGEIIGSKPEFESVMADLKRDNGVRALYYDMYGMAIDNLREAIELRSSDPYTHFYFGKALNLTAHTRAEKAEAMAAFVKTIQLDQRQVISGPWMHRALALMADRNPDQNQLIIGYLQKYVEVYQQEHGGDLPANMDAIYAYLKDLGDESWVARPVVNISTRNIDPIRIVSTSTGSSPPTGITDSKCPTCSPVPSPPVPPRSPARRTQPGRNK
jgi:hypothetical protein